MTTAYFCVAAVLVAATLLPLWRNEHWLVRSLDFPRLQLLILLGLTFVTGIFLLDLTALVDAILLLVLLACMVYHAWWILPYAPVFRKEVKHADSVDPDNTISIITANVLTPNKNAGALLELVHQNAPDILVTLESDQWWQSRLDVLEVDYPHTIKCPLDNLYGMHVYSRLPLLNAETQFLVEDDKPSMHCEVELRSGRLVHIHFLHPAPPSPTENETSGPRDKELVMVAKMMDNTDGPRLVTGDLNDVAWSETTRLFRKISGLLDPRVGRGMFNSFHASYWFLRWPLDHLFVSHHFTLSRIRRLPGYGSDHFAIFAELVCTGENGQKDRGLSADSDDEALAREKLS